MTNRLHSPTVEISSLSYLIKFTPSTAASSAAKPILKKSSFIFFSNWLRLIYESFYPDTLGWHKNQSLSIISPDVSFIYEPGNPNVLVGSQEQ